MDAALLQLGDLVAMRLLVLSNLAESLEASQSALVRNDAEMIARGAARQAQLCREWSLLEDQLRRDAEHRPPQPGESVTGTTPITLHSQHVEKEFAALTVRIRHLARVHWSLLRHLERSLAVLARIVESCEPTYVAEPGLLMNEARARAGE